MPSHISVSAKYPLTRQFLVVSRNTTEFPHQMVLACWPATVANRWALGSERDSILKLRWKVIVKTPNSNLQPLQASTPTYPPFTPIHFLHTTYHTHTSFQNVILCVCEYACVIVYMWRSEDKLWCQHSPSTFKWVLGVKPGPEACTAIAFTWWTTSLGFTFLLMQYFFSPIRM